MENSENISICLEVKKNLQNVLFSEKFCCLCFGNTESLYDVYEEPACCDHISIFVQIQETVGDEIQAELPSNYICESCKNKMLLAFTFLHRVKKSIHVLHNYLNQLHSEIAQINTHSVTLMETSAHAVIAFEDPTDIVLPKINNVHVEMKDNKLLNKEKVEMPKEETKKINPKNAICDYCKQSFTKRGLISHIQKHLSNPSKIKCPQCKEDPCIHEQYLVALDNSSKFFCVDCNKQYTSLSTLITHVNKHHLSYLPYICEICSSPFPSVYEQKAHMAKYHSDSHDCKYCYAEFVEYQFLKEHEEYCKFVEKEFQCAQCGAFFIDNTKLSEHEKAHSEYACEYCPCVMYNDHSFRNHMKVHKSFDEKVKTYNKKNVKKSSITKDKARRIINCYLCEEQFLNHKELRLHRLYKHSPSERYVCKVCKKSFKHRSRFVYHLVNYQHQIIRNKNDNVWSCMSCASTFHSECELDEHIKKFNHRNQPYTCEICGKTFAAGNLLKIHVDRHTGKKNYHCNYCGAKFTAKIGLRCHILRIHASKGMMNCCCEFCGKTFTCPSELKLHELRYHSKPSEPCPFCNVKYNTVSTLRMHIKRTHFKNLSYEEFIQSEMLDDDLLNKVEGVFKDRRKPCF